MKKTQLNVSVGILISTESSMERLDERVKQAIHLAVSDNPLYEVEDMNFSITDVADDKRHLLLSKAEVNGEDLGKVEDFVNSLDGEELYHIEQVGVSRGIVYWMLSAHNEPKFKTRIKGEEYGAETEEDLLYLIFDKATREGMIDQLVAHADYALGEFLGPIKTFLNSLDADTLQTVKSVGFYGGSVWWSSDSNFHTYIKGEKVSAYRRRDLCDMIDKARATPKKYACIWGNWDKKAQNDYKPLTGVYDHNYFTSDLGYTDTDLLNIRALQIGEDYNAEYGNHFILRIE